MRTPATTLQRILAALTGFLVAAAALTRCCPHTQEYPLPSLTIREKQFLLYADSCDQDQTITGQAAATRGLTEGIRLYGAATAQKFSDARHELTLLADSLQIPLPQNIHSAWTGFTTEPGATFDSAYISTQTMDYRQIINTTQDQLNYGSNSSVKAYANKYRSLLLAQLAWADSLKAALAHS